MICFDGEKYPIVWYHADCVGLSEETVPAGSWFCKDCDHCPKNKLELLTFHSTAL